MRDLHSKQYYINNTSTFPSIPALIHFYRSNYLNAKLKTQLLYPVYTEEPQEEYVELTAVQSAPTTTRMHNGTYVLHDCTHLTHQATFVVGNSCR